MKQNFSEICLLMRWMVVPPSFPVSVDAPLGTYSLVMITMIAVDNSISFPLSYFIGVCSETVFTKIQKNGNFVSLLLNSLLS